MTKRMMILVGFFSLTVFTNLSFRIPTKAQAQVAPVCDLRICFADGCTWCNRLDFPGYQKDFWVRIPGVNFGLMVSPYGSFSLLVRQALNCNGFVRYDVYSKMVAEYVAAQLSVQQAVPFWYPELRRQKLECHVDRMLMPGQTRAIPATLSDGRILDGNSSLQDLFDATDWAAVQGTIADRESLLNIYLQLNNCRND